MPLLHPPVAALTQLRELLTAGSTHQAYFMAAGVFFLTWLASLKHRDASLVDRVWGLAFLVMVGTKLALEPLCPRSVALSIMVALWGIRLSVYLHRRNRGRGEDPRYRALRRQIPLFPVTSLVAVFGFQALLAMILVTPMLWTIGFAPAHAPNLGATDLPALILFAGGLTFESLADWQLARFKADPQHQGRLLTTGLWSRCRHPNYFGETVLWWGFFAMALPVGAGWLTVFAPLLMTILLLRVSGVSLLEKRLSRNKPGFEAYQASTPAFWPRLWPRT